MLHLKGIKDVVIEVRYSEDMENERVKHNVANETSEFYLDKYVMCGDETEHWAPDFTYRAFRYLEIVGYPEMIWPEQIEVISAGTGILQTGAFHCSNSRLNQLYQACMQTQKNNVLGQLVDCPHREQAQYLGDSDLQAEAFSYNFYYPSVLRKVLHDFRDGQYENGRYPFVYPGNVEDPDFNILIPEYDMHFVTLLEKVYEIYGDREILVSCYPSAAKMVHSYWNARNKDTGLLQKGCGFPIDWNISDWPYPDVDETGEFLTAENCMLYRNIIILKKIAALIGKEQDTKVYGSWAEELKKKIVDQLYDPSLKRFVDCIGTTHTHQGVNALAFRSGLVPESDEEAVLDYIASQGIGSSTLLMSEVLRVLFENGREQTAYECLCETRQPSWGICYSRGTRFFGKVFII